ncbi:MAG: DNA adenine methylase [Cloacibacterium sp.]|nr:DNA adenine methylase [Cloacibacterium sp.]
MKNYTQAPLPFQGQKRRFLKPFKEALKEFSSTATYVDLFGGSGFLSHTIKQIYPDAIVIYNDYDNYAQRLGNIENTNKILKDLNLILRDCEEDKKIDEPYKTQVIERLSQEKGFIDFNTISANILFSMKYFNSVKNLEKSTLYKCLKQSEYNADDYLQGVEVVSKDYRKLWEEYNNIDNVVYIIDPPYLSTDTTSYNKESYWELKDYLNVLKCVEDKSYFYFTSNKSQIIELCEWLESNSYFLNPFAGATTISITGTPRGSIKYEDIMIYRNASN